MQWCCLGGTSVTCRTVPPSVGKFPPAQLKAVPSVGVGVGSPHVRAWWSKKLVSLAQPPQGKGDGGLRPSGSTCWAGGDPPGGPVSQQLLSGPVPAGVNEVDYSRYPARETQLQWLHCYLQAQKGAAATPREVERLYVQVSKFALVSAGRWQGDSPPAPVPSPPCGRRKQSPGSGLGSRESQP